MNDVRFRNIWLKYRITVCTITLLVSCFFSQPGQSVFIHSIWEDCSKQRWQRFKMHIVSYLINLSDRRAGAA